MARVTTRKAFLLCLLVLLQECGPAHFAHVSSVHRRFVKQEDYPSSMEEVVDRFLEDNDVVDNGITSIRTKRGWGSVFKAIKYIGKGFNIAATAVTLSTAVYRLVHGCCGKLEFPGACTYKTKFENTKAEVEKLTEDAKDIWKEARRKSFWVGAVFEKFNEIYNETKRIYDAQALLILSLDRNMEIIMNNATDYIKRVIRDEHKDVIDGLRAKQIVDQFKGNVMGAISTAFEAIALAVPTMWSMVKFARKRAAKRVYDVAGAMGVEIRPPKTPGRFSDFKVARFFRNTKKKMNAAKTKFTKRFKSQLRVAKFFKKGLVTAFSFFSAGYAAWSLIKERNTCRDMYIEAKKAYEGVLQSKINVTNSITKMRANIAIMDKQWGYLRSNLTSEDFRDVLVEIKEMTDDTSKRSPHMKTVSASIQTFLNKIKHTGVKTGHEGYNNTYDLSNNLFTQLSSVPFNIACHTAKVTTVRTITYACKTGTANFDHIFSEKQKSFNMLSGTASNPDNCKGEVGFKYLHKVDMKASLAKAAKKDGFSSNCILNNEAKKRRACRFNSQGQSVGFIAGKVRLTAAEVTQMIYYCPLTTIQITAICADRKESGRTNQQSAQKFKVRLEAITKMGKCPEQEPISADDKATICEAYKDFEMTAEEIQMDFLDNLTVKRIKAEMAKCA